jgi:hypothetical protein
MNNRGGPGRPFRAGNHYGKGRPAGSRNKATIAMEELLDGEGDAIVRKAIELAIAGNETALRLCVDRLISPRRERLVRLKLPSDITTSKGVSNALTAVLKAVAEGEVTPGEAVQIAGVLEINLKATQPQDVENRLSELERRLDAARQEGPNDDDPQTAE